MGGWKYPIHGDAGTAWFLVFDQATGAWVVETTAAGQPRSRQPLAEFETTEDGRRLTDRIKAAIDRAASDA